MQNTKLLRFVEDFSLPLIFVCLFVGLSLSVKYFFTMRNMIGLALSVSQIGMVACTMMFCLAARDFDLSIGSPRAFPRRRGCGAAAGSFAPPGPLPPPPRSFPLVDRSGAGVPVWRAGLVLGPGQAVRGGPGVEICRGCARPCAAGGPAPVRPWPASAARRTFPDGGGPSYVGRGSPARRGHGSTAAAHRAAMDD